MTAPCNPIIDRASRMIHDYITGPDGETYAIGRGLGIALFVVGLAMPTVLAIFMMKTQSPSLSEWTGFVGSLAAYLPALTGAVAILIWGTNPTEPMDPTRHRGPGGNRE